MRLMPIMSIHERLRSNNNLSPMLMTEYTINIVKTEFLTMRLLFVYSSFVPTFGCSTPVSALRTI